jgi:5-methylcytosine-specific restriction endonuclease McrA
MNSGFSAKVQDQARARANGFCEECGGLLKPGQSQVDHIKPRALGGTNELSNAQVLCTADHLKKSQTLDMPAIRKGDKKATRQLEVADGMSEIARRFFGGKP